MKKRMPMFFILIIILFCSACDKSSAKRPPTIPFDKIDWSDAGNYKYKYVLSEKRINSNVRYINEINILIDDAIKTVMEQMQEAYNNGELPWEGYSVDEKELYTFRGEGYYISTVPITTYCNNINMLLDNFSLSVFNEEMTVQAEIYIENLNGQHPEIHLNANRAAPAAAEKFPDMQFIKINVYDPPNNTTMLLGEDNDLYGLSDGSKSRYTVEGDVFYSLPENMRFSYKDITDKKNLIWIEYEK